MRRTEQNIFLIDASGALLSAVALGLVLPRFPEHIGLPAAVLRTLSLLAALFGAFSFSWHLFATPDGRRSKLQWLAGLNLGYCLVTVGLVVHYADRVRTLGVLYFASEVVVLVVLAWVEWGIALRLRPGTARP
jgi:hypothetical protein